MLSRLWQLTASTSEALLAPLPNSSRPRAQVRVLDEVRHRPWALPERPWLIAQTWDDLLFAHWSLPVEAIRPAVPA
jgi:hypothetical protein